jgi:hypothetical protein
MRRVLFYQRKFGNRHPAFYRVVFIEKINRGKNLQDNSDGAFDMQSRRDCWFLQVQAANKGRAG